MKDSDWAGDSNHRKSVTGIVIKLAGGTVLYKARFQETIALSTTEAEFIAAVEAGKYILYLRSILHDIGMTQDEATILYEDNQGSLLMAQAQHPTKRTRYIDIKHFVLQDWCEQDLILIKRINTTDNSSDILTKATTRTTFYRHTEYIQGKVIPEYVKHSIHYYKKIKINVFFLSFLFGWYNTWTYIYDSYTLYNIPTGNLYDIEHIHILFTYIYISVCITVDYHLFHIIHSIPEYAL